MLDPTPAHPANSADDTEPPLSFDQPAADEWEVDNNWGGMDLEAAYSRALAALDLAESTASELLAREAPEAELAQSELQSEDIQPGQNVASGQVAHSTEVNAAEAERIQPEQVLEACLFVGGGPLTTKRLASLLKSEAEPGQLEEQLASLNRKFLQEGRPYEIRLTEGGYQLALREEFESLRRKSYGLGPREVRLSQESLEALAVVAYHEPIDQAAIEALVKAPCGATLRQLLRRELIVVQRPTDGSDTVLYRVTQRCLSLFGVRNTRDLPRPQTLAVK